MKGFGYFGKNLVFREKSLKSFDLIGVRRGKGCAKRSGGGTLPALLLKLGLGLPQVFKFGYGYCSYKLYLR